MGLSYRWAPVLERLLGLCATVASPVVLFVYPGHLVSYLTGMMVRRSELITSEDPAKERMMLIIDLVSSVTSKVFDGRMANALFHTLARDELPASTASGLARRITVPQIL